MALEWSEGRDGEGLLAGLSYFKRGMSLPLGIDENNAVAVVVEDGLSLIETHFNTFTEAVYFIVITFTTVGYGDVKPITVGGKIFTGVVLIIGVGIVAMPTAILASSFNNAKKKEKY